MTLINATSVKRAREYREQNNRVGGVVLLWNARVYGWKNELRDPQHERPGAIAIDENGNQWVARGGNDDSGADRWEQIVYTPEFSPAATTEVLK